MEKETVENILNFHKYIKNIVAIMENIDMMMIR